MKPAVRWVLGLFVALMLVVLAGGGAVLWWLKSPLALASEPVELAIEPGTPPREIAQAWVDAGVRTPALLLFEWFRWSGQSRKIRAGSYEIGAGTTPVDLLDKMVRGDSTTASARLIEGWTFRQFRAELAKAEALKPTTAAMSEAEIMVAIGEPGVPAEGRFYPDTYAYSKGSADLAVLKRAHRAMRKRLEAAWGERAPETPLKTADEALTLASIVEKETAAVADRGRIAGVFVNRLRIGMPLQTDPTVIYGMGQGFDGNLRKRDLQTDTPFNTYLRSGLPPTPIAMPGKAALLAAVRPAETKALYFVSRGDGSSEFSETLADHNRAVNKYQRGR
ncbi:MAG: endolytic transglycosylase MltG [Burkholderiaceae bacterium]